MESDHQSVQPMKSVFLVQHVHMLPSGCEDIKFIGAYRSVDLARAAVNRLKFQPGFCNLPHIVDPSTGDDEQGFHIAEYELDKDHWAEGYVTV